MMGPMLGSAMSRGVPLGMMTAGLVTEAIGLENWMVGVGRGVGMLASSSEEFGWCSMQHEMGLYSKPFESIRSGRKLFEIRLCDEKRKRVEVGDTIVFRLQPNGTEQIRTEVVGLQRFASFEQLYQAIPLSEIDCEGWTMPELLSSTYQIYTKDQELQHGALAIEIRLIP